MIIDLHVHTIKGGHDSSLSPQEMIREAVRIGLDGIAITEHDRLWSKDDILGLAKNCNIKLFHGLEITTDKGHILAFGFDRYISGMYKVRELRKLSDLYGAVLIWAHPYRRVLDNYGPYDGLRSPNGNIQDIEEMSEIVHILEVANGNCADEENMQALLMAQRYCIKGTGGSDAHSKNGLGYYVTVFEKEIATTEDLVNELKNGHFYPAHKNSHGGAVACEDLWNAADLNIT